MTLAIALDTMEIDRTQNIKDGLELAASPLLCPYVRSTFYLESEDKGKMGQQILYGDRFFLRSTCRSDMPLYIHVTIPNLTGPVGRCGYPVPKLSPIKNYESTYVLFPFVSYYFVLFHPQINLGQTFFAGLLLFTLFQVKDLKRKVRPFHRLRKSLSCMRLWAVPFA